MAKKSGNLEFDNLGKENLEKRGIWEILEKNLEKPGIFTNIFKKPGKTWNF